MYKGIVGNLMVNRRDYGVEIFDPKDIWSIKIMVLEEDIFRVLIREGKELITPETWIVAPGMEDVPFKGRNRLDLTPFTLPEFIMVENKETISLESKNLKVLIQKKPIHFTWYKKIENKWKKIAEDRSTSSYNLSGDLGEGIYHYMKRDLEDKYYGLGEKTGVLNRHGRRYRMKNIDPMGYDAETTDPLYKHIPFYITKNEESYGLLYDNLSNSTFDMGNEMDNYHGQYRYYHAEGGDLDYYFISGDSIKGVLKKYVNLTGQTIMGPKWSLGYSGSTMTYTDADNAQEQLYTFIDDCKKYDISCDSFQLSSGYTSIENKRYVFHWNREKFPKPEKFIEDFNKVGIKLCANIKPALLIDHPLFDEVKQKGLLVKDRSGKEVELVQFWDEKGAYLDFTNPDTIDWWKKNVKSQLLDKGIASTWNDNNEYEIWDNQAKVNGFGQERNISELRPVQPLLMMKASLEAQKEHDKEVRPYLISRSGCPGMHRYAQTWTGDNRTSWKSLKYNIRTGIGLSLSGVYNFGHDVGGFAGNAPDPELFVRWVQNGIFHPRFTIHSWNDDKSVNVPWMHKSHLQLVKNLMDFRVQLIPYLYDLLYKAHRFDEPMIRPTFLDFEHDLETFNDTDEFLLGQDILVVNGTEANIYMKSVYLPKGADWFEYGTDVKYSGGQYVKVAIPLDKPNFFVRAGSVLPISLGLSGFNYSDEKRVLNIYPKGKECEFVKTFYEDDGQSEKYKAGEFSHLEVFIKENEEIIDVHININGEYTPTYNAIQIQFPISEARSVYVNENKISAGDEISIGKLFQR